MKKLKIKTRQDRRRRIHYRIRKRVSGTATRPRLAVHFSNKNIYAQLIDDDNGQTIATASTLGATPGIKNTDSAKKIGETIAAKAKDNKIDTVVFDRGGHPYLGRVKVLADAAREAGLTF